MKKTGAWLAVYALEQLGVRLTFGIPGVHNTELYDELNNSKLITPVLVTHEGGASFMADGVSRTSSQIGTLVIVPAAGATHAASGIAEAFLDGIPMLVICGGIRTDIDRRYQLHEIDQHAFLRPLTKATFHVLSHEEIVPTLFEAHRIASDGEPGPVFVEIPVNLQLFPGEIGALPTLPTLAPPQPQRVPDGVLIEHAARELLQAQRPGLFVGWGARGAIAELRAIAEFLQAPVATTLQGLASFPASHPLHVGFGFGPASVPAARQAFANCDGMLAVATRFAEIATGSFGAAPPERLIHVDINPSVFNANYPACVALEGDAKTVLAALLSELQRQGKPRASRQDLTQRIAADKAAYLREWLAHDSGGRVNPARFFQALRQRMPADAITVVDDGNHTYLTAELFPIHDGGRLIVPTDFNAMGYAVPAAIGARLANPDATVFGIVGDGAFMMTCMELLTAGRLGLGIVYFVFHDGELSQIAQAQSIPYGRKPCTALGVVDVSGIAQATGAAYVAMQNDSEIDAAIVSAMEQAARGRAVVVDVAIDYSKRTAFTQGAVKTNFRRFPLAQRVRMVSRAIKRRITG
ncbi:MAG TPA: thiamine pyrophosphate-binding protein [Rhodocyclaceae bacterium]|nr:thiamine pyrophosphate-binding protein [Rhodocyclaceae bacterium]